MLGKNNIMDEITAEQDRYGDLIVGDFWDSYDNLPEKTFMGFQFFANNCYWKKKKMLILQDTDCFISGNSEKNSRFYIPLLFMISKLFFHFFRVEDTLIDYGILKREGWDQYSQKNTTMGSFDVLKRGKASLYWLRGFQLPFRVILYGTMCRDGRGGMAVKIGRSRLGLH